MGPLVWCVAGAALAVLTLYALFARDIAAFFRTEVPPSPVPNPDFVFPPVDWDAMLISAKKAGQS